jgi:hypothetical protein
MEKGKRVRLDVPQQGRLMHQTADCKVRHQEPVELLSEEVRGLAAQDDPRTAQTTFYGVLTKPQISVLAKMSLLTSTATVLLLFICPLWSTSILPLDVLTDPVMAP